jgi:hypothetical protein
LSQTEMSKPAACVAAVFLVVEQMRWGEKATAQAVM